ncbi:MAG: hypothetical protein ACXIUV_00660 [Alkalilacustris sp.]
MARDDAGNQGGRLGRRGFFGMAVGAAAGGAFAMGGARPTEARQVGEERTRARYQRTEHVETFYRVNRFPQQEG